jgi:Bax protein
VKECLAPKMLFATLISLTILTSCESNKALVVKTETVKVDSLDQVILLEKPLVKPILYTQVSGLEKLPFIKAKETFISAVLPAILIVKHQIASEKNKINALAEKKAWDETDSSFYLVIMSRYKAKTMDDLKLRLQTLPNSIVLAQAAVETGWGESRFFVEGSNLFGIWSYGDNEKRIAAGKTRKNKTIYLRSYPDMSQSVVDYFKILASARAYRSLRAAQVQTTDPFVLIPHLKYYSEQRSRYTNQLKKIIRQNDLTKYDQYQIDPEYLVEEIN